MFATSLIYSWKKDYSRKIPWHIFSTKGTLISASTATDCGELWRIIYGNKQLQTNDTNETVTEINFDTLICKKANSSVEDLLSGNYFPLQFYDFSPFAFSHTQISRLRETSI